MDKTTKGTGKMTLLNMDGIFANAKKQVQKHNNSTTSEELIQKAIKEKIKTPEVNEIWYNSQNDTYFLITKVEESSLGHSLWILYPNGYSTRIQANEDIHNVYNGKFYHRCSFVRKSKLKFEDIFTH